MVSAHHTILCVFQDYSDANSVLVRGRATLKLRTNKTTINMESHSTEVLHSCLCPLEAAVFITVKQHEKVAVLRFLLLLKEIIREL